MSATPAADSRPRRDARQALLRGRRVAGVLPCALTAALIWRLKEETPLHDLRLTILLCALAAPLGAQQVVGHLPTLPAGSGFNAFAPFKLLADPDRPRVFALTRRGVVILDRSASPSHVSFATGL